jgi:LDH2 family malate/lactate/ureidoglycolate dehydrogenase
MATTQASSASVRVWPAALRRHAGAVLCECGVPAQEAEVVAELLVDADMRGVESHGVQLLAMYVGRLRSGHLRARTEVTVERDDGATVLLHGGLGFGQVAGLQAIDLAVHRADGHGLAAVAVKESTHLGALGYYTRRAAMKGFIGFAFQNGPTIVPPYGGVSPMFSTNPFSYAVPAGDEHPVVYDVATTTVAGNKILLAKKRGDPTIPPNWANDDQGRPTTDTAAASVNQMQWFGGHKGYGLAFLVELLAGVLAGSCFGRTEVTASELHGRDRIAKGYVFVVMDPARFLPAAEFAASVDTLIRDVRSSSTAEGFDRVFVPGEIEQIHYEASAAAGLLLSPAVVAELNEVARSVGVAELVVDDRKAPE